MCCPARPVPFARRGWPCRTFCKFGEEQDVASGNSSPSQSLPVSGANALVFATDCVQTCLILQKLEIASEQSCSTSEKNNATSNASSETFDLQLQENFGTDQSRRFRNKFLLRFEVVCNFRLRTFGAVGRNGVFLEF